MYHIKNTRYVPGDLAVRAREYLKTLPRGWLTVTQRCRAFTSSIGSLGDTPDARELGPTIAQILEWEYGFDEAEYYEASNSISVCSRADD